MGLCGLTCQPLLMCPPTLGDHCPTKTPRGATTRRVVRLVCWLVVHPEHSGVPWHPPRVPQGLARLASHSLLFILNLFPMKAWGERCVPQNQGIFTENPTVAKGQCLGQGFQPTFRGHCSWGAGEQEGPPCLDRLMHVVPLGELVCQCMSCSTHGGCAAVGRHACAPRVRCTLQACSAALCFLSTCTTHPVQALHTHSCTLTAGSMHALCQHCRFTRSTLCSLCAHSPHTPNTLCVLCASPARTLCSLSLHRSVCMFTPRAPCTLCSHSEHTPSAGRLTKAMQVRWTLCTLHPRSGHTVCSLICTLHLCSPHGLHMLCASSVCTLAAHPRACPLCAQPIALLHAPCMLALCSAPCTSGTLSPCTDCMFSPHTRVLSARSPHTRPGEKAIKAMSQEDGGRKRGALGGINRKLVTLRRAE